MDHADISELLDAFELQPGKLAGLLCDSCRPPPAAARLR